jgi:hypothetical protein
MTIMHCIGAGFVDFDEVGVFLQLLADHGHQFRGIVGVSGIRKYVLFWIEMEGVFVSTKNINGISTDPQPRSGDQSLVNRIAYRCVG